MMGNRKDKEPSPVFVFLKMRYHLLSKNTSEVCKMTIETANRLVELRKSRGLSQEELAQKLGISRQAVSKWEQAESAPDTDNIIMLAQLYGVTVDELLMGRSLPADEAGQAALAELNDAPAALIGSGYAYVRSAEPLPAMCGLSVEVESAHVTVKTGEVNEPRVELSGSQKLIECCTVSREGDTLYVIQQKRRRVFGLHINEKLYIDAVVPKRMRNIGVDIGGGGIEAEGVTADSLIVRAGGGGIKLTSCEAERVSSTTGGGGSKLNGVKAKSLACTTGGGGTELANVSAETAEVKTGGGGLHFNNIDMGFLTAKTGGGGIDADGVTATEAEFGTGGGGIAVSGGSIGMLSMKTGGGSLKAELDVLGGANCNAGAGGITLVSRANVGAEVNLNAISGKAALYVAGAETVSGRSVRTTVGDGSAKINVKTASGNITVKLG